jgi:putative phosphoribosyl transferase
MNAEGKAREIEFKAGRAALEGTLMVPKDATALVIFAHGSGSSRFSKRNQHVAKILNDAGLATFLFDLLTRREEALDIVTSHLRFNIDLLSDRLLAATAWAMQDDDTRLHRIGYFGASTGAAAALMASAELPRAVGAVVSRGGRPDLASAALPRVVAPTMLIVGGNDRQVLEMNRKALTALRGVKQLEVVPDAGHLFEETGALDMVAQSATKWFEKYLVWNATEETSSAS